MGNVVIGCLSYMKEEKKKEEGFYYALELQKGVPVVDRDQHTNCGTVRVLQMALKNGGQGIHKAIYLASEAVRKTDEKTKKSLTIDYFERMLKEIGIPSFEEVDITDKLDEKEAIKKAIELEKQINEGDHVYIDLTGGNRQTAFVLFTVSRILQEKGISIEGTLVNYFDNNKIELYKKQNPPCEVFLNSSVSDSIDYAEAVSAFMKYADPSLLLDFFRENGSKIQLQDQEEKILTAISSFTVYIKMCQPEKSLSTWQVIRDSIKTYLESNDKKTEEFEFVIELLSRVMTENYDDPVCALIDWCMDKGYVQQATTIFNERIPDQMMSVFFNEDACDDSKREILYRRPRPGERTFMAIYDALQNATTDQLSNPNYPDDYKWIKTLYLIIDSVRDHFNHASEDREMNDVEPFYQKVNEDYGAELKEIEVQELNLEMLLSEPKEIMNIMRCVMTWFKQHKNKDEDEDTKDG